LLIRIVYPSDLAAGIIGDGKFAKDQIPLERVGTEEDIAGAILFLTSRAGAYITGNILVTDGGRLSNVPSSYWTRVLLDLWEKTSSDGQNRYNLNFFDDLTFLYHTHTKENFKKARMQSILALKIFTPRDRGGSHLKEDVSTGRLTLNQAIERHIYMQAVPWIWWDLISYHDSWFVNLV
jgi:hypothetical protein